MKDDIERITDQCRKELDHCETFEALRDCEVKYIGKKGLLTSLRKDITTVAPDKRKEIGALLNERIRLLESLLVSRREFLQRQIIEADLADESFDWTLPGKRERVRSGSIHPLHLLQTRLEELFMHMGFYVMDYPEVESEFYNFEGLNIPRDHPARDMQDTFWIREGLLLRTHTSAGQVRAMKMFPPPFRAIFPGKVYRYEAVDASHEHTFHQLEGLMIDKHISVAHLIAIMKTLLVGIFGRDMEIRLRPGYFPFVEPGFELDIACQVCLGKGCSVCKQSGWVELLPCGLVHPNVIRFGGLDPEEWNGWAFGLGLSRLVMMKYKIDDIRLLLSGDIRFLSQFNEIV